MGRRDTSGWPFRGQREVVRWLSVEEVPRHGVLAVVELNRYEWRPFRGQREVVRWLSVGEVPRHGVLAVVELKR